MYPQKPLQKYIKRRDKNDRIEFHLLSWTKWVYRAIKLIERPCCIWNSNHKKRIFRQSFLMDDDSPTTNGCNVKGYPTRGRLMPANIYQKNKYRSVWESQTKVSLEQARKSRCIYKFDAAGFSAKNQKPRRVQRMDTKTHRSGLPAEKWKEDAECQINATMWAMMMLAARPRLRLRFRNAECTLPGPRDQNPDRIPDTTRTQYPKPVQSPG